MYAQRRARQARAGAGACPTLATSSAPALEGGLPFGQRRLPLLVPDQLVGQLPELDAALLGPDLPRPVAPDGRLAREAPAGVIRALHLPAAHASWPVLMWCGLAPRDGSVARGENCVARAYVNGCVGE